MITSSSSLSVSRSSSSSRLRQTVPAGGRGDGVRVQGVGGAYVEAEGCLRLSLRGSFEGGVTFRGEAGVFPPGVLMK